MNKIGDYDTSLRLEETILPSANSVDLKRTIENHYYNRFIAQDPNIAESYHVNSNIIRYSTMKVPPNRAPLNEARDWFFESTYKLRESDFNEENASQVRMLHADVPNHIRSLVETLANPDKEGDLLSGLDVFIMFDNVIYRIVPARTFIWVEKIVTKKLENQLLRALLTDEHRQTVGNSGCTIFIIGCFWRYQMFYGPRGYRMALMDAGRMARAIQESLKVTLIESFYDNEMNQVLLLDGIERSTLNLLVVE